MLIERYLTLFGERFEYETAMLIETLRKKVDIEEVPIRTIYIDGNAGTHFRPLADSWAIYKLIFGTFMKYSVSSLGSSIIDLSVFQLLILIFSSVSLGEKIVSATVGARIVSSLCNYLINKNIVFSKNSSGRNTFFKYYTLCVLQMGCSAIGVYCLCQLSMLPELIIKIIVDSILFFLSFRIQQNWIFNKRSNKKCC